MAIYIENLKIEKFRGIRNLSVAHLNHINLIAGDNNCGKTSFLEAILLLRNPQDFNNTLSVARLRDSINIFGRISPYEALLTLFPHSSADSDTDRAIKLQACCKQADIAYSLQGKISTVMLDADEQKNLALYPLRTAYKNKNAVPAECQAFQGELAAGIGSKWESRHVTLHEYATVSGRDIARNRFLNVVYLPPFAHLQGKVFADILANEAYKDLCVNVLQLFDKGISDLLLLKNENTNRSVEYVKHRELGYLPLTAYGDGIKKVLSIASGIAKAANGVLLIDEAETAIHAHYFNDIFLFISAACRKFNVQVFITSHSIEAIDSFLAAQDYADSAAAEDSVSVVTLTRDGFSLNTYARVLSGRHVFQNREQFGFEVRL